MYTQVLNLIPYVHIDFLAVTEMNYFLKLVAIKIYCPVLIIL